MLKLALAAAFALAASTAAFAQVTDPDMSCAAYIKQMDAAGPTPKTGDTAMDKMAVDMEKKVRATCTATPNMKAMEAVMKAMAG